MPSIEGFKAAFRTKSSNKKHLAERVASIQRTLTSAMSVVEEWKAEAVDEDWKMVKRAIDEITGQLTEQVRVGRDNPATAIRALGPIEKLANTVLADARKQRPLVVPGFTATTLSPQFVGGYDQMETHERAQVARQIGGKISRGQLNFDSMMKDDFDPDNGGEPSLQDVSDMAFFLRAQAEAVSGDAWKKGALTIPDPGGKIRKWLDKNAEVYTRDSSHLTKDDQASEGGQARGIDFVRPGGGDLELQLPYGLRTLLYQKLERGGEEYLYIKMETEGARFNPTHKHRDGEGPDSRALKGGDVGESIRHLKNLLIKEKDKSGLKRHAEKYEDVPKDVRAAYDHLLKSGKEMDLLDDLVSEGVETKKKGIKRKKVNKIEVSQMAANIAKLRILLDGLDQNPALEEVLGFEDGQREALRGLVDRWDALAKDAWGDDYELDVDHRVGDEVILRKEDLQGKTRGPTPPAKELVIDQNLPPNPVLWFLPIGGTNYYHVSGRSPGPGWARVEQFCAHLAATWLAKGGKGNLKFGDLGGGEQVAAVDVLKQWSAGGLVAQQRWAISTLGGASAKSTAIIQGVVDGRLPVGAKIWFGTDAHAMAAKVLGADEFRVYDPNTGSSRTEDRGGFVSAVEHATAFVMAG